MLWQSRQGLPTAKPRKAALRDVAHGSRRRLAPPHHEGSLEARLKAEPHPEERALARVSKGGPHAHLRVLATRCARVLQLTSAPKRRGRSHLKGGCREDRVRAAPAVSCAKCTKENAHEHTGSAEAVRPSLRNGSTAYFVLSLATGLFCHHRRADTSARLDASNGASGPHDFAVRKPRRSSARKKRATTWLASTASRPNVRDDGQRPSSRDRTAHRGD
jgi:hypothetical protein